MIKKHVNLHSLIIDFNQNVKYLISVALSLLIQKVNIEKRDYTRLRENKRARYTRFTQKHKIGTRLDIFKQLTQLPKLQINNI